MYYLLQDEDLEKMSEPLKTLLREYLAENFDLKDKNSDKDTVPTKNKKANRTHIRFSYLFDAGITKAGMPVRVQLTKERRKQLGCERNFINGLEISRNGTVIYQGQEYDKVSPLAEAINNCPLNGWQYIEIKKNGDWIKIDNLRQQMG